MTRTSRRFLQSRTALAIATLAAAMCAIPAHAQYDRRDHGDRRFPGQYQRREPRGYRQYGPERGGGDGGGGLILGAILGAVLGAAVTNAVQAPPPVVYPAPPPPPPPGVYYPAPQPPQGAYYPPPPAPQYYPPSYPPAN